MTSQIPRKNSISGLFKKEIENKSFKDYVRPVTIKIGILPKKVLKESTCLYGPDIYLSAKALMHIFERHNKVLVDHFLDCGYWLFNFPDYICENIPGKTKRGDILFFKHFPKREITIMAALELINKGKNPGYHVATMFLYTRQNLINRAKKIWGDKNKVRAY